MEYYSRYKKDKQGANTGVKLGSLIQLIELQETFDLQDVWRVKNPDKKSFTFRQKSPTIQCRLDYFLVSSNLQDQVAHVDILTQAQAPDHKSIILNISVGMEVERGSGYWKFNGSLVNDEEYVQALQVEYQDWKNDFEDISDKRLKWDLLKYKIRNYTMRFCSKRKKERIDKEDELANVLKLLEQQAATHATEKVIENIEKAKEELRKLEIYKTEGAIIRSRIQWIEEGEKSTKYFYNLENNRQVKKHIKKIQINEKTVTQSKDEILTYISSFYENLYSSKASENYSSTYNEAWSLFFNNDIPKLSGTDKQLCEKNISGEELKTIMKSFKKNKSPGNDGITIEFYEKFWDLIEEDLV